MIGFDFPIKPEWAHDVHQLCAPGMLVDDLIRQALQSSLQELGGEKTKRNTLGNILRYLIRTEGAPSSRARKLAKVDVLVTAAQQWPVTTIKPIYLARILLLNDVAYTATRFVAQRYDVGDTITRNEIRQHITGEFGERKVVLNAVSSFVRTLDYFGVFTAVEGPGRYRFNGRLSTDAELFPLLVLAWLERYQTPQIDLEAFQSNPAFHFLTLDDFAEEWRWYNGRYWSLESRLESARATLKYPVVAQFEKEIVRDTVTGRVITVMEEL
jgi:hypothetical protein